MSINHDKSKNRNHVKWPDESKTGSKSTPLVEPVPSYKSRSGDGIITASKIEQGVDNNASIILGRDRNPYGPPRSRVPHGSSEDPNNGQSAYSEVSGFSDHMGAGAIDIVVGRGAPFPLSQNLHDEFPQGLPPLYRTRNPAKLTAETLTTGASHPAYVMDAARIYMSQMCQIDDYFKIKKINFGKYNDTGPSSAIMLKADKLRFHSRRDIYIVAGGDVETPTDSNNYKIQETGKIHLVAKNQQDPSVKKTTPAVRYDELRDCIKDLYKGIQGVAQLLNNFLLSQKELNKYLAHATFGTAVGFTTSNPPSQCVQTITDQMHCKDLMQINSMVAYNVPKIETNYLMEGATKCFASKHVTIN
tara:strand:- start:4349 stop:5425 length:1077 start_codon:yes stop_codon:yes gene_type:complete